jgi:hypothetical protein
MGWQAIDTVRCARCAVFTPTDDLRRAADGTVFCVTCGPPPTVDREDLATEPPARPLARSPLAIAAAICAGIFAVFVAVAELAS